MSWGISENAPEIQKIKADANDYLKGHNSVGDIDYLVYSEMFDYLMPLFDKAYQQGKKDSENNQDIACKP